MRGIIAKRLRSFSEPPARNAGPVMMPVKRNKPRLRIGDRRRLIYKAAKQLWKGLPHNIRSMHIVAWNLMNLTGAFADDNNSGRPTEPQPNQGVRGQLQHRILARAVQKAIQNSQRSK